MADSGTAGEAAVESITLAAPHQTNPTIDGNEIQPVSRGARQMSASSTRRRASTGGGHTWHGLGTNATAALDEMRKLAAAKEAKMEIQKKARKQTAKALKGWWVHHT